MIYLEIKTVLEPWWPTRSEKLARLLWNVGPLLVCIGCHRRVDNTTELRREVLAWRKLRNTSLDP